MKRSSKHITPHAALRRLPAIALALVLAICCTGVEYGPLLQPETSRLRFNFDWSEAGSRDSARPSVMPVAMARMVSEIHYLWDTENFYCPDSHVNRVGNGEYFLVTFAPSTGCESYDFSLVDRFLKHREMSVDSLVAELIPYDADSLKKLFGRAVVESDYTRQTVIPEAGHLYSTTARESIYFDADGGDILVSFSPLDRTQLLSFTVDIQTESGVQIDSVTADITGTPRRVGLMSGALDSKDVCKTYFRMQRASSRYEGSVRVLGLFTSNFTEYIYGAGVIRLTIFARCEDKEQVVQVSLNIKELIDDAGIMKASDDNLVWTIACAEATIDVDKTLTISKELIMNGNEDCLVDWVLASHTIDEDI